VTLFFCCPSGPILWRRSDRSGGRGLGATESTMLSLGAVCPCACVCFFVIGMFCVHWNVSHTGQSSRDIELIFYTEIGLEPFDLLS
jgi:hypothetical protein